MWRRRGVDDLSGDAPDQGPEQADRFSGLLGGERDEVGSASSIS